MGRLRFGIFLPGFHTDLREDVTASLHSDVELLKQLDELGYDEAWIGEHHSGGAELISDPAVFIAHAANHTRTIKLALGVLSLPYHNPLLAADQVLLLDHLTRGRLIVGIGSGALPSDAAMIGLDPRDLRGALEEDAEVFMRLLTSDEPVTKRTSRYTLTAARTQLQPYSDPVDAAVASIASPTGARVAGQHGMGLLSIGATSPEGFEALAWHWSIVEKQAQEYGLPVPDRGGWRLVGPMHIAETREQAIKDVEYGLVRFAKYTRDVCAVPHFRAASDNFDELVSWINDTGIGVIGTPDDAIRQIQRLEAQSGGFGAFLMLHGEWADPEATRKHFELFARYVKPAIQQTNRHRTQSEAWCQSRLAELDALSTAAVQNSIASQQQREAAPTTS
ncbi:LLM class flavin-dependent oxidoreductase [Streptomyces sp. cg40]|uniref:LLM class flavin-dependent oxidoreductase n=1 Tax=Streptomyces sp. cg40 TaxID=3419764 RepID=UPI003CFC844A